MNEVLFGVLGAAVGALTTHIVNRVSRKSDKIEASVTLTDLENAKTALVTVFEKKCEIYRSTCPGKDVATTKLDKSIADLRASVDASNGELRKEMREEFRSVHARIDKIFVKEGSGD